MLEMRGNGFGGNRRSANHMSSWNRARSGTDLLRGGRLARVGKSVVSFAPMAGGAGVMVSVSAMAIAAMGVLSGGAWAQNINCDNPTNTTWHCKVTSQGSVVNSEQVMNISEQYIQQPLEVTINDDVSFLVTERKAILMGSSGGIRLTQSATGLSIVAEEDTAVYAGNSLSIITGASGPSSQSSGTGVALLLTGTVTGGVSASGTVHPRSNLGESWRGIHAFSDFLNGGSVTVTAATVTGADDGIDVSNRGTGVASVTTTGDVMGHRRHGITVKSSSSASVSATKVTGSTTGIKVDASGTLSISASDLVTATGSTTSVGIDAISSGEMLTITAAAVTGSATGIRAVGSGTGEVRIQATGEVKGTGTGGMGIYGLVSNASGGALTITATSTVTGSAAGIRAVSSGTGTISVKANGTVKGTGTAGIQATGGTATGDMTIDVAAVEGAAGIKATQGGTGKLDIKATGTVTAASGEGIYGSAGATAGTLTITAEQTVTGSTAGIRAIGGSDNDVRVLASGAVSATPTNGVGIDGLASSGGDLTITAMQTVSGGGIGIKAISSGAGAVSVNATGAVTGTATAGVQARGGANTGTMTINVATVTGAGGVDAQNSGSGLVTITATGTVTGTSTVGILGSGGGAVTITAAAVAGGTAGIRASGSGAVNVNASAEVTATGAAAGIGIDGTASGAGALTITAAAVTGSGIGINVVSSGAGTVSVSATGAVTGTATAGIQARGGANTGTMTIDAAAVAGKSGIDARQGGTGKLDIKADGAVMGTGTGGLGIYGSAGATAGTLTITAGQTVTGSTAGIRAIGGSDNDVLVLASGGVSATGANGVGIDGLASSGGDLTITAMQTASGAGIGIKAISSGAGSVSVNATGAVTGTATAGVQARGGANTGTMTISVATVTGAGGIDAQNTGSGLVTITATGTVTGSSAIGILGSGGGAVTITAAAVAGGTAGIRAFGSGAVNVNASAEVTATGAAAGIGIDGTASGAGALTITAAAVTGSGIGIKVVSSGAGTVSISATGEVKGTGTAGIQATGGTTTGAMAIDVATVTGKTGIEAKQGSANKLDITATGAVTGTGASGAGIDALVSSAGALSITAAAVTGSAVGIKAISSGAGAVSVRATGAVLATGAGGIGVQAQTSGGALTISAAAVTGTSTGIQVKGFGTGSVSISASGAVTGTGGDGIFVEHDGSGATNITVTTAVTGSTDSAKAAIRTDVSTGGATILLNSGASVGAAGRNAIIGSAGSTTVTANSGATITGTINLGSGDDTLTVNSGATINGTISLESGVDTLTVNSNATISGDISLGAGDDNLIFAGGTFLNVTEMDGGAGDDELNFRNVSGTAQTLSGWEEVAIESGATIAFGTGTHSVTAGTLTVGAGGRLDVGNDSDTDDELTVTGDFEGGGTVILNANFFGGVSDKLTISGTVSETTTVTVNSVSTGLTFANSVARIDNVITLSNTSPGTGVFTGGGTFSGVNYELRRGDTGNNFHLVRTTTNNCEETPSGSGVFVCRGTNAIRTTQSLSATGATALSVTLNSETPVEVGQNDGFNLTQSGTAGITLTQSANGKAVMGGRSGIVARSTGGGAISINVNGTVTGRTGSAIDTFADSGNVTVSAAAVTGSSTGIKTQVAGAGSVTISASGAVTGTGASGIGIDVSAASGNVTVSAAAVTGSSTGIRAQVTGAGSVSISASGAVTGTGASGVGIDVSAASGNVAVSAASVTGMATGIRAVASGTGVVSILATGRVGGTGNYGIYVDHNGTGATTIQVSSAVTGGSGTTAAAIRTNVSAGSDVTILLNSGASVGDGAGNAIVGGAGDSTVTVNNGAKITGKVSLGSGADMLTFDGGDFSSATILDGGAGNDTLRFSGGSGSLNPAIVGSAGEGLKGWENVVVQSGANISGNIKLANDSGNLTFDGAAIGRLGSLDGGSGAANTLAFNNVTGSLATSALSGWETLAIGARSRVTLTGSELTRGQAGRLSVGGTLVFGSRNSTTDTFTVRGNFAGGGIVVIDANFARGSATADTLVINGNVTGTTTISLNDLTAAGARTDVSDITVVTVSGSAAASAFTLASNTVFKGSYNYTIVHVPNDSGTGATFVLRPTERIGEFHALLGTAPRALLAGYGGVPSMSARQANRRSASAGQAVGQLVADDINAPGASKGGKLSRAARRPSPDDTGVRLMSWASAIDVGNRAWIVVRTLEEEIEEGPIGSTSEVSVAGFDAGFDAMKAEGESGDWSFGLIGRYGTMDLETKLAELTAKMDSSGYGIGGNATWGGDNGVYVDTLAIFSSASSSFTSADGEELATDVESTAAVASVEAGRRIDAGDMFGTERDVAVIPHARLSRSSVSIDETDIMDIGRVDFGSVSNLVVRVGTTLEFALEGGGALRLSGSVSRDVASAYEIDVDGRKFAGPEPATWAEVGFGGSMGVGENARLHFDGAYRSGGGSAVGLSGGVSWSW